MRDIVPMTPRFRFLNIAIDFSRFVPVYATRSLSRVYVPTRTYKNIFKGRQIFKSPSTFRRR